MSVQPIGAVVNLESASPDQKIPAPNFDRLAHVYRWMEYLSFGPMLERCRFRFLSECTQSRRALVLGDGDGRFTARLLKVNPDVRVDAVDVSTAMLEQVHRRALRAGPSANARLQTVHADLRDWTPLGVRYDLVVSHFSLDCLSDSELERLVGRLAPHLSPGAEWIVSEFAFPAGRLRRAIARPLIRALYLAFSVLTNLRIKKLPDHAGCFVRHDCYKRKSSEFLGGLLIAEIWQLH